MRNQLRGLALAAIVVFGALVNLQTAQASQTVYVAGSGGEFGTINLTTGAFTAIGPGLDLGNSNTIFGMGFGSNGNLYGVDSGLPTSNLFQINTTTGVATPSGGTPLSDSAVGAGADASGKLYVIDNNSPASLYTLQPPSATTTTIGSTGIASDGLVAVNANGSQIFTSILVNGGFSPDDLGKINPSTGVATDLGSTGFLIFAGLFVGDTLYGFTSTGEIVTLNTTTGAATQVATYSLPNGDSINAAAAQFPASVPEPSSLILGLISTVALVSVSRFQRRRP
jgi:hypothetical protein